jgi:hypothetical protein
MIVTRKSDGIILRNSGVQKIGIGENGFIIIDGVAASPPMTIESETIVGFLALESLEPMFKHMKCWNSKDGTECPACPVKHDGICGIMGIKDAAEKEAIEKEKENIMISPAKSIEI